MLKKAREEKGLKNVAFNRRRKLGGADRLQRHV